MSTDHKFAPEQELVVVDDPVFSGQRVTVIKLIPERCHKHSALVYGCTMGGDHISVCEANLAALSTQQKRKLN